jgi:hypothetical protein
LDIRPGQISVGSHALGASDWKLLALGLLQAVWQRDYAMMLLAAGIAVHRATAIESGALEAEHHDVAVAAIGPEQFERSMECLAAGLKANIAAWNSFCAESGVARSSIPYVNSSEVTGTLAGFEDISANVEDQADYLNLLRMAWQPRLGARQ